MCSRCSERASYHERGSWIFAEIFLPRIARMTRMGGPFASFAQFAAQILVAACRAVNILTAKRTGNLKSRFTDFLNADGEKPWRNRDAEFESHPGVTSTQLFERWNEGWVVLFSALQSLSDTDLLRTVTIRGVHFQVHEALHRLLAHTSYHVGQIVYLAKSFRGSEWKTLSIPLGKSEQYNRDPTLEKLS